MSCFKTWGIELCDDGYTLLRARMMVQVVYTLLEDVVPQVWYLQ